MHVVEGGDTGWRMDYQYLSDRGPWNREQHLASLPGGRTDDPVQPAYIVPPIINLADGPSGLVYYPGIGLPERYRGHFFLADFRGRVRRAAIRSFARGAARGDVQAHRLALAD